MARFWIRIAVWSSLHEPVLIYGSSHESVFESPLYRVHNEHESGSGPSLLQRVRILLNESETLQHASEHMNSHKHTLVHVYTPQHTRINIRVCPHIYVYKYTNTYIQYTCLNTNTHACPLNTHAHNHHAAHATSIIHIIMHTCSQHTLHYKSYMHINKLTHPMNINKDEKEKGCTHASGVLGAISDDGGSHGQRRWLDG